MVHNKWFESRSEIILLLDCLDESNLKLDTHKCVVFAVTADSKYQN